MGWKFTGSGQFSNSKYTFAAGSGSVRAIWGDYTADANEFIAGKIYFQNELKVPKGENWNYSGFKCIDSNYSIDENTRGYLFMAYSENGCPVIPRAFGNNRRGNFEENISALNKNLNENFYNAMSEDLKNKIYSFNYTCREYLNSLEIVRNEFSEDTQMDDKDRNIRLRRSYSIKTKIFIPSYEELRKCGISYRWDASRQGVNNVLLRNLCIYTENDKKDAYVGLCLSDQSGKITYGAADFRYREQQYRFIDAGAFPVFVIRKK